MAVYTSTSKVGVYVDAEYLRLNGGFGIQYDVLREFACRDGAEAVRLNVYIAYDRERAARDSTYKYKINEFFYVLREYGYKINRKFVKWFTDESGNRFCKANADLDMGVDALLQSEYLDRVVLATGDGDFVKVVRALQNKGCRVEIVAFQNVSEELRYEADMFMPGYLIPGLFPIKQPKGKTWGEVGSLVIGRCYHYDGHRKYGYLRYLSEISGGLWITDARNPNSPYRTAYFETTDLPDDKLRRDLPNRNLIFQFKLAEPDASNNDRAADLQLLAQV
ncbi:MAG TPA: NYN domain-containing protein [Desulfobacterales bacterium]